ncbi:hypothetical protein IRZ71_22580 [Flavobacterium sp. ANB]|uniref:hypothetical protein n=1 Tax=unclassified Flavobacterium TaxID=196869 RepID=UPI00188B5322|nr:MULTISPECIES: hypothetical protein [unclassified Flavobacterium]MBF4519150.1 hypothetical protein [Flavobacterium sp. ANB]
MIRLISKTILFLLVFGLFGCRTPINRVINDKREGYWMTVDTLDHIYVTQGRYQNDFEKGTWKHFYNGKLVRKERYKNNICKTKYYYPNGNLMKKGSTKLEINNSEMHWFYFGEWRYYKENGKLDSIKNYQFNIKPYNL